MSQKLEVFDSVFINVLRALWPVWERERKREITKKQACNNDKWACIRANASAPERRSQERRLTVTHWRNCSVWWACCPCTRTQVATEYSQGLFQCCSALSPVLAAVSPSLVTCCVLCLPALGSQVLSDTHHTGLSQAFC